MNRVFYSLITSAIVLMSCSMPEELSPVDELPPIWPDYSGTAVPYTIAPLNFSLADSVVCSRMYVRVLNSEGYEVLRTWGKDHVEFPVTRWHSVLAGCAGSSLTFQVYLKKCGGWVRYRDYSVDISLDDIDFGLTYRLIMAGYQSFGHMGICQRNLSDFCEEMIFDNRMVDDGCLNCHTCARTDPACFSLHVRGDHSATLINLDGNLECLNTATPETGGFFVYPYWHPSNKYIAYSVNKTRLSFYTHTDKKLEVYDLNSDVILYEPGTRKVILCEALMRKDRFETYPAFSPDGRYLYFCVSQAGNLPAEMNDNRYSLCRIEFDAERCEFADDVDTLVSSVADDISLCTPRPSYDGKYIMLAGMDFGTFPLWHKEADLYLYDVRDGSFRNISEINSSDAESFHNWSSNSKWVVFSSRRDDGLYTRLYLSHMDDDGRFTKPFILPQKNPKKYYDALMYSYNVPDFTSGEVDFNVRKVRKMLLSKDRSGVSVR